MVVMTIALTGIAAFIGAGGLGVQPSTGESEPIIRLIAGEFINSY